MNKKELNLNDLMEEHVKGFISKDQVIHLLGISEKTYNNEKSKAKKRIKFKTENKEMFEFLESINGLITDYKKNKDMEKIDLKLKHIITNYKDKGVM